jgi:formylglycine-generating enzyme required for sulfatase activity
MQAVAAAPAVVAILSAHATASPHVVSEIGHAFGRRIPIVPIRMSAGPLPPDFDYFLSLNQWLDIGESLDHAELARIVEATRAALAGKRNPPGPRPRRRRILFIAAAPLAALAVAGALYWKSLTTTPPAIQKQVAESPKDAGPKTPPEDKPPAPAAPAGARTWTNPKDGAVYVFIPPGTFTMGCSPGDSECRNDEKPSYAVEIATGFWLARTEVTVAAYAKYAARRGLPARSGDPRLPITGLSWPEAKAYCIAVGGRLPTEAEWEYAARAGTSGAYYGPLPAIAWYEANSEGAPQPGGRKRPNAFGLYDMLGNVSEWVLDRYYDRYYTDYEVVEPLALNATATARGGYWGADAARVRVSYRAQMSNFEPADTAGIRCAAAGPRP